MDGNCWEYSILRVPTGNLGTMQHRLNEAGWAGWEVVGFAAADKTIGLNEYAVIVKRPKPAPFAPPSDLSPAWHPDPSGRHSHRWWTGTYWDATVGDGGETSSDPPKPG